MPASKHNSHSHPQSGSFYVVATPIGNLADLSLRAIDVLKQVDLILAEDTRHSRPLLNHYGITTSVRACHEHNEDQLVEWVVAELEQGRSFALISDAGTPLISDPGFVMVRRLRAEGADIQVVPGPSAVIAAFSIAGLPTDSFVFDGFLPAKQGARRQALERYLSESRTVALFESSHRIVACLEDIVAVLGTDREVVVARELSKKFETVLSGTAQELVQRLQQDSNQQKGEFVVLIAGLPRASHDDESEQELRRILGVLLAELPVKQAAAIASQLTGCKKNQAYQLALEVRDHSEN